MLGKDDESDGCARARFCSLPLLPADLAPRVHLAAELIQPVDGRCRQLGSTPAAGSTLAPALALGLAGAGAGGVFVRGSDGFVEDIHHLRNELMHLRHSTIHDDGDSDHNDGAESCDSRKDAAET